MPLLSRLYRSLNTWPSRAGWVDSLACAVLATALIAIIAGISGLLTWRPDLSRLSPLVFVIPAFTEELLFRAPLPARGESARPILWLTAGVTVFTLWHVVEALTFLPGARLFLTPGFLACAALVGTACARMRYATGSLWPGVIFHGLFVLMWQTLFAGPSITELR